MKEYLKSLIDNLLFFKGKNITSFFIGFLSGLFLNILLDSSNLLWFRLFGSLLLILIMVVCIILNYVSLKFIENYNGLCEITDKTERIAQTKNNIYYNSPTRLFKRFKTNKYTKGLIKYGFPFSFIILSIAFIVLFILNEDIKNKQANFKTIIEKIEEQTSTIIKTQDSIYFDSLKSQQLITNSSLNLINKKIDTIINQNKKIIENQEKK